MKKEHQDLRMIVLGGFSKGGYGAIVPLERDGFTVAIRWSISALKIQEDRGGYIGMHSREDTMTSPRESLNSLGLECVDSIPPLRTPHPGPEDNDLGWGLSRTTARL